MTIPHPITKDWLFGGNVAKRFTAHMNLGTCHAMSYDLVDRESGARLGMQMSSNSYKRTHRDKALAGRTIRTFHVGDFQSDDVEEALAVLNEQRRPLTVEELKEALK